MNIWLINHYAVPPQYYPLARQTYFAKNLMAQGHTVKIFAASTVHNSDLNLITDSTPYKEIMVDGVSYVLVKCKDYQGNGLKRIYNMCEFALKLPKVCKKFNKPDAIVSTSMPPTSCAMGVRIARKYGCSVVAEIADLWPESIVAYEVAGKYNPAVLLLRRLEKWIYKKADSVVFTMENAYDYIVEQKWEKAVPREKVFYINNGVDIEAFDKNKEIYKIDDEHLLNKDNKFNVIYVGSIRLANNVGFILDVAKELQNEDFRFLLWGDGTEKNEIEKRIENEGIKNVFLKGKVEKKYIPYIVSQAHCNFFVLKNNPLYRFGLSLNKSFDYLASGKPILMIGSAGASMIKKYDCGIQIESFNPKEVAEAIRKMHQEDDEYQKMCTNSRNAAYEYDFKLLTKKLLDIICR